MRRTFVLKLFLISAGLLFFIGWISIAAIAETAKISEAEEVEDPLEGFEEEDEGSLEGFEEEDKMGFAEISLNQEEIESETTEDDLVNFGGFLKEEIAYSYQHEEPDYSKIRSTLNLSADLKFSSDWKAKIIWNGFYDYAYSRIGRERFSDELLQANETQSEIRDFFIDGALFEWLYLKAGRQIIAWGESESAQITDVANPRDMRELGMVDLEDARVPVTATKLTVLSASWEVNLIAVHEIRTNKIPAPGSEFDMLRELRRQPNIVINEEEIPESKTDNTEYLMRLFKTFNGGDISLILADIYDDSMHLDFHELSVLNSNPKLTFTPRHKRIRTVGLAGNMVSGSWLFKAETAMKFEKAMMRSLENLETQIWEVSSGDVLPKSGVFREKSDVIKTWSEKNLLQLMVGLEYSGIESLTLSVETVGERIENYEDNLIDNELSGMMGFSLTHSSLNDNLNTRVFWIRFNGNNGDVIRLNVDYDIIDALNVSVGVIAYEASQQDAIVYSLRENNRILTALKYSF